jgi:hypothetical protein
MITKMQTIFASTTNSLSHATGEAYAVHHDGRTYGPSHTHGRSDLARSAPSRRFLCCGRLLCVARSAASRCPQTCGTRGVGRTGSEFGSDGRFVRFWCPRSASPRPGCRSCRFCRNRDVQRRRGRDGYGNRVWLCGTHMRARDARAWDARRRRLPFLPESGIVGRRRCAWGEC